MTTTVPSLSSSFHFKGVRFIPYSDPRALKLAESFEVRDDDVFVSAYIKSGTTCAQQIVSLVSAEGDLQTVTNTSLKARVPWLETMDPLQTGKPMPQVLKSAPSPRLMKTHLPYHMLPTEAQEGKGKIIYCARNVKDVVVSFHNMKDTTNHLPSGTFDETFQEFINPEQACYGFWWDVVAEYWRHKGDGNMLFIKTEDMKRDLRGHVVKIANFLGKTLSARRIDEVVANCTVSAIKENPATNKRLDRPFKGLARRDSDFIRKASLPREEDVAYWRDRLTLEQSEALDSINWEKMAGVDLTFEVE